MVLRSRPPGGTCNRFPLPGLVSTTRGTALRRPPYSCVPSHVVRPSPACSGIATARTARRCDHPFRSSGSSEDEHRRCAGHRPERREGQNTSVRIESPLCQRTLGHSRVLRVPPSQRPAACRRVSQRRRFVSVITSRGAQCARRFRLSATSITSSERAVTGRLSAANPPDPQHDPRCERRREQDEEGLGAACFQLHSAVRPGHPAVRSRRHPSLDVVHRSPLLAQSNAGVVDQHSLPKPGDHVRDRNDHQDREESTKQGRPSVGLALIRRSSASRGRQRRAEKLDIRSGVLLGG